MDVVLDGYLLKSPPNKRFCKSVFSQKWRQRWFVLRHSGQIPGQFVLDYYSDSTLRKHKGTIDLDQCEQVDAGLQFESRKTINNYMFNIHTPKRIYYLVAETEAIMNKWVDSICSVCGLKARVDEEMPAVAEPAIPLTAIAVAQPQPVASLPMPLTNLTSTNSESSPYIPISECITGKPISNGVEPRPIYRANNSSASTPKDNSCALISQVVPPSRPIEVPRENLDATEDFYVHPKPLTLNHHVSGGRTSPEPNMEDMYRVPPPITRPVETRKPGDQLEEVKLSTIPRVNWDTYPAQKTPNDFTYDVPVNSGTTIWSFNTEPRKKSLMNMEASDFVAPPRPPKPAKLSDKTKEEEKLLGATGGEVLYDTPSAQGVFLSKQNPAQAFAFLKDVNDQSGKVSPSTKVPLLPLQQDANNPSVASNLMDDMYDFPRFRSDNNLSKRVPLPIIMSSSLRRPRQHAYTNAPPGLFNGKENVMNYEFRPSLMTKDCLGGSTDCTDSATDSNGLPSPFSPIGSDRNYANSGGSLDNLLSHSDDLPPKINRNLKPKKKLSDPTEPGPAIFNLAPPPALVPGHTKRSFRKQRAAPSPTPSGNSVGLCSTMPAIPYRTGGHHTDHSSSDDISSSGGSRRNSANDDQVHFQTPPAPHEKRDEIHYLDLDLDSEGGAQSARSPDRASNSTVYKTVDFVKTKAFNVMRQNVEETYRKNQ